MVHPVRNAAVAELADPPTGRQARMVQNSVSINLGVWRNWQTRMVHPVRNAALAELADAYGSEPYIRKDVWVQLPPAAFLTGQGSQWGQPRGGSSPLSPIE